MSVRNGKKSRKKWIWIGVAVVVVAASAVFIVSRKRGGEAPEVTVESIGRTRLVSRVSANGQIEAKRKVDLSANVMGQIVNLAVREGDAVERGEFLMQIDQTQLAAEARGAEASLAALFHDREAARANAERARGEYQRAERARGDELISQSDLEAARATIASADAQVAALENRIEQARAGLAGARDTLSKTKIVAPMSGTVTRLPVAEGEVAVIGTMNNPGTVLMTISDMSVVEAVMQVDETDVPSVHVGQAAEVTVDAYGDQVFAGVVTEVASSPIQAAGGNQGGGGEAIDFEVKIQLTAPPEGIHPGFSCSADVITGTRADALAAPLQAIVVREKPPAGGEAAAGGGGDGEAAPAPAASARRPEEEGVYVYRAEGSKVEFVPVETGLTGETQVEVVSGLSEGDRVVTGPFRVLREIHDGDAVKLEQKPKGGGPGGPGGGGGG